MPKRAPRLTQQPTTAIKTAPTLLVLAAGMSSRYGGKSKQTDAMGPAGETLLDYSVFDAVRAGFGKVVFVIRREGEKDFRERVVSRLERQIPIELAYQEQTDLPEGFTPPADRTKPWGTCHAVLAARRQIHEAFAVINADDFYGRDSFAKLAAFLQTPGLRQSDCRNCMVGFILRNTVSEHGKVARGICVPGPDGCLASVEEHTDIHKTAAGIENRPENQPVRLLTGSELVSMNMWGFVPEVLDGMWREFAHFLSRHGQNPKAEYYIPLGIDALIRAGQERVRILETSSQWFGVTYHEDKPYVQAALQKLVANGEYPAPLWG